MLLLFMDDLDDLHERDMALGRILIFMRGQVGPVCQAASPPALQLPRPIVLGNLLFGSFLRGHNRHIPILQAADDAFTTVVLGVLLASTSQPSRDLPQLLAAKPVVLVIGVALRRIFHGGFRHRHRSSQDFSTGPFIPARRGPTHLPWGSLGPRSRPRGGAESRFLFNRVPSDSHGSPGPYPGPHHATTRSSAPPQVCEVFLTRAARPRAAKSAKDDAEGNAAQSHTFFRRRLQRWQLRPSAPGMSHHGGDRTLQAHDRMIF
mmetsp:Transcript_89053/g.191091  ORF Transcript_89053/g.191091 Transcript_89053/m.191091 type:complete len:262 (-) Transcript_89053:319-1104(-)